VNLDAVEMKMMNEQKLLARLGETVARLVQDFDVIDTERRQSLANFARLVEDRLSAKGFVVLNFICTHNSRRSHISQLWAQAASYHFGIPGVRCLSGGTEATAFNPRAVEAMRALGFAIEMINDGANPRYEVRYSSAAEPVVAFSKRFDDASNVAQEFIAIMTCDHADENCPFVPGAHQRISLWYDDPKHFDGTELEQAKYLERAQQIGRELLYAFSLIRRQ